MSYRDGFCGLRVADVRVRGRAKRVGTLLREQRARDEMLLGRRGGVAEKEEKVEMAEKEEKVEMAGKEEGGKDGKVEEQRERVVGGLRTMRGEGKGEVEKVKGMVKGYGGLKRGDARLWQH